MPRKDKKTLRKRTSRKVKRASRRRVNPRRHRGGAVQTFTLPLFCPMSGPNQNKFTLQGNASGPASAPPPPFSGFAYSGPGQFSVKMPSTMNVTGVQVVAAGRSARPVPFKYGAAPTATAVKASIGVAGATQTISISNAVSGAIGLLGGDSGNFELKVTVDNAVSAGNPGTPASGSR